MATISILDGLSQEETLNTILSNLTDAINKLAANSPRTDAYKRVFTNGAEVSQTVTGTLNGVSDIGRLNAVGANIVGTIKILDAMPVHLSNSGAIHIYDNIKFT